MDPLVQTLILKRFRSVPSESVHFDNPTFLVGRNGSGKSNLVDAIDFMAEAMTAPLQAVFDKRGGISVVRNRTAGGSYPPNLGLGVVFGRINREVIRARYAFEVRALKNYGLQVFREQSSGDTIPNCLGVSGTPYLTAWANSGKSRRERHCGLWPSGRHA